MTVSATEGATSAATFFQTLTGQGNVGSAASEDKQMFLQLLVAQMKYQDPSNPADSTQFLTQTAQFTSLEKMEAIADQTMQMVSLQAAFGAAAMVGKDISFVDADGRVTSGTVDSVRFDPTGPVLAVGGVDVPMSSVLSMNQTSTPVTNPGTPTTPSNPTA